MRFMWQTYIRFDPHVMMGKPVFAGTRIPVDLVLERVACGEALEDILVAYPRLTREAILAAFAFASEWMRSDVVYPIPANA